MRASRGGEQVTATAAMGVIAASENVADVAEIEAIGARAFETELPVPPAARRRPGAVYHPRAVALRRFGCTLAYSTTHLALVVAANWISRRVTETSLW